MNEPGRKKTLREIFDSLKTRWQETLAEYGMVALGVWLTIFALAMTGFTIAISQGIEVEGAVGRAGIIGGAYAATQLTKPIRIVLTLALTPVVARILRKKPADTTAHPPGPDDASSGDQALGTPGSPAPLPPSSDSSQRGA